MTSARSVVSGSIIGIEVPGTFVIGEIRKLSSVAGVQVTPYCLSAADYIGKPAALAALRPTRPTMLGPAIGPPGAVDTAWQRPQRWLKIVLPFSRFGLAGAATPAWAARAKPWLQTV